MGVLHSPHVHRIKHLMENGLKLVSETAMCKTDTPDGYQENSLGLHVGVHLGSWIFDIFLAEKKTMSVTHTSPLLFVLLFREKNINIAC